MPEERGKLLDSLTGVGWMDREILNMEEAAELFGVSVKTFIKLLKEEKVPARKIGREWRFSRKALIEWLSAGNSQDYSSSEGEAKEFFNGVAPEWEEIRKKYCDEPIGNKILSLGILRKDMTVVDLGSGDGYLSRTIAGFVKKVIAVDISKEMLRELERKARESGITNIVTIESDAMDVPLEDAAADMVCASMYLHHIDEPELAIKEMCRLAKQEGIILLADLYEHANSSFREMMHDVWPGFRPDELKEMFAANGFKKIRVIDMSEERGSMQYSRETGIRSFLLLAERNPKD